MKSLLFNFIDVKNRKLRILFIEVTLCEEAGRQIFDCIFQKDI